MRLVALIFIIGQPLRNILFKLGFFKPRSGDLPIRPSDGLLPFLICGCATIICFIFVMITWLFFGVGWSLFALTASLVLTVFLVPFVNRILLNQCLRKTLASMNEEEIVDCNKRIEKELRSKN